MMITKIEPIKDTTRQRVTYEDGRTLERTQVYLTADQWESLIVLAKRKRTSASLMIGHLIDTEFKFRTRQ
jgi:hypothetical protein